MRNVIVLALSDDFQFQWQHILSWTLDEQVHVIVLILAVVLPMKAVTVPAKVFLLI